jgi:hypothetical protein
MTSTTSKLEMSLDEIINAQKSKGQAAVKKTFAGGKGARKVFANKRQPNKRASKFKRGNVGAGRIISGNRNMKPKGRLNKQRKVGMLKRQNNAVIKKKINLQNKRNIVAAAKKLVRKLVKKAIAQNLPVVPVAVRPSKRQIRVRTNRLRQKSVLNRINVQSRAIGRRYLVNSQQNSPVAMQNVNGRGPIRFNTQMPTFQHVFSTPSRIINSKPQRVKFQPQQPFYSTPRRQQLISNNMSQNVSQVLSVRAQINAMRRANRVQQLQNQFVKQQPTQKVFIQQPLARRQFQQVIMSRPPRRTQYILIKQQTPRQKIVQMPNNSGNTSKGFFRRQQLSGQRRNQKFSAVNTFYEPPNFLQRI